MVNRLLSITNVIQFHMRTPLEYQQMKKHISKLQKLPNYTERHYKIPITTVCRVKITLVRQDEKGETSLRQILDDRANKGYLLFAVSRANVWISVTDISRSDTCLNINKSLLYGLKEYML